MIPHRVGRAGRGGFFYPRLLLATILGSIGLLLAFSAVNVGGALAPRPSNPKLARWVVDHTANGQQAEFIVVLADQADLGLVSYPVATKDLAVIPWREEEMVVATAVSHPLAQKAVLLPADLDGQEFIGFDEDLSIRRELDRFFREQGIEIRLAMQFDNIQMIKEAVALGSGISILPARTMLAEVEQGRLVAIPLHAPELLRPVGIVHQHLQIRRCPYHDIPINRTRGGWCAIAGQRTGNNRPPVPADRLC